MYSGDEFYGDDVTSPLVRPVAPHNTPIARYASDDDSVEARVVRNAAGRFVVTVRDLDAEQTLGAARLFDDKAQALDYARRCVN
jgi:hypothetical protein